MTDRSTSRGREPQTSSGRGGLGNMTSSSTSRDRPVGGPDDFSSTRGREPAIAPTPDIRSTGRGGAGNIGSPSRDRDVRTASEQEFIRAHDARELEAVHSTGRGGIGNISGSHSRERGGAPLSPTRAGGDQRQGQVHSSGRGGAGNIVPGPAPPYERGRSGAAAVEGIHSTGRGGLANLTSVPSPPPDTVQHHPGAYESSGRGGAGNISASRERGAGSRERVSNSQERGSREREQEEKGGIAGLWNRIHPHAHPHPHPQAHRTRKDRRMMPRWCTTRWVPKAVWTWSWRGWEGGDLVFRCKTRKEKKRTPVYVHVPSSTILCFYC
ncbi:hypothetical protein B0H13DRAFT_1723616 [Mycena leptocephala]|nr:hypothetical protein B0H13DRAFT_1723616 [Mycena leptocephala]